MFIHAQSGMNFFHLIKNKRQAADSAINTEIEDWMRAHTEPANLMLISGDKGYGKTEWSWSQHNCMFFIWYYLGVESHTWLGVNSKLIDKQRRTFWWWRLYSSISLNHVHAGWCCRCHNISFRILSAQYWTQLQHKNSSKRWNKNIKKNIMYQKDPKTTTIMGYDLNFYFVFLNHCVGFVGPRIVFLRRAQISILVFGCGDRLCIRNVADSEEIQLRIDPMHSDLDDEITCVHGQVRQLKNVRILKNVLWWIMKFVVQSAVEKWIFNKSFNFLKKRSLWFRRLLCISLFGLGNLSYFSLCYCYG